MARIGLADLAALHVSLGEAMGEAVERVARSGRFVLGPVVESFERALARYAGVDHAVGVGSGSDALLLALRASGVQCGDVVVTSPLTFVATVEAIVRLGAVPRFVDVDPSTLCLSRDALERYLAACGRSGEALTDPDCGAPVRALVPVHLYGRACDAEIERLGLAAALACVHDAAQAIGARQEGTSLGAAAPACLSFFPTKNLGCWGDGGAVVTNDIALASRVRFLRQHGRQGDGSFAETGLNSRLDALQAAVLEVKLGVLDEHQRQRRDNAARYTAAIAAAGLESHIVAPPPLADGDVCHLYTVRVLGERRDALHAHLDRAGIATGVYYRRPLCDEPAFAGRALWDEDGIANARQACGQVLSLPVHAQLPEDAVERVVAALSAFYG